MPAVAIGAAISGLAAGTAISAAGVLTIGFSFSAFATSLVLGGLSYALQPKPKKPSFSNTPVSNTVAVRQSDLSRQIVYGHTRITRGYAHMEVTGTNGKLHIFLMLCEGELRAINEVWLDDYVVPNDALDVDGNVISGRYAGKLQIIKHLGSDSQLADPLAVVNLASWTTSHRLQGIAYLYMILTKDQNVYPNGVPNLSAVVEGGLLYDPRVDAERWTTNTAIQSTDFITDTVYGFGALDDDVDYTNIAAQANICDEMVDTDEETDALVVASIDIATDIITLTADLLPFQYGDRVQVTSSGTLPTGITALTNYYVIPYQIKTTPRIKLATSLLNAMAGTAINLTGPGTGTITVTKNGEPRYHGGGIIDTGTVLSDTLNNLSSSMAGRTVNIGGFWTLLAGAWRTPVVSFDLGDMRAGYGWKNCQSMSDSFNIVKGLFVSSVNSYQSSDYPAAKYNTFIDDDGGIEAPQELNLPFTNRPTTAQRIAKIELFRARQDITLSCSFSGVGLGVQPGDNVMMTIPELGFDEKYYEITEFTFDISPSGFITRMSLRETAAEIFDWTSGEAISYDPAPNTNLPNPFLVGVPTGVGYNSRSVTTAASDEVFTLVLQWDPFPDNFVTEAGMFELQFKKSAETDWRPSFFVDGKLTEADLLNSSVNIAYDLRIRARNRLGVVSNWVTIFNAVAGSSGGITITFDYRFVNEAVGVSNDWGFVYDAPGATADWGFVT